MEDTNIIIIGAGVIGLAIAAELSKKHKNIILLEKLDSFGRETSSRNSEVIHGGMYYPTGTLKAKMCVEGRPLLYELCKKAKIPYRKTGKLIVATENEEILELDKLFMQGKSNGVSGLRIVEQPELKVMEPNIAGILALYSEETGIIDSHRLMQYFLDSAKDNGATIAFNSEVIAIDKAKDGYRIQVNNNNENIELQANFVINCAGLDSDSIAQIAGLDIKRNNYELHYCKGQYFRVSGNKSGLIKRLVYPVPKPKSGGLGIHATLDLAQGLRLGPDDQYLDNRIKDYLVDESKKADFYASAKKFMPFLNQDSLSPDTSGIRPKLMDANKGFRDFIIKEESENGLERFVNLIGIESPGLTSCAAIGKYVGELFGK